MSQGQISDDGMWRWDGQRWVPNQPGPPSAPPAPPKKSNRGRNFAIGCGGAAAALVALIVIVAIVGTRGGSNSGTHSTSSPGSGQASCTPQPCAEASGMTLSVSNVNTNATADQYTPVQPGMTLVTMSVEVKNQSYSGNPMVNPFDFKLQDSAGTQHNFSPSQAQGCPMMNSVNVAKGGTSGPQCLTFQVPQGKTTGMKLLWQNSSSLFGNMEVKVT